MTIPGERELDLRISESSPQLPELGGPLLSSTLQSTEQLYQLNESSHTNTKVQLMTLKKDCYCEIAKYGTVSKNHLITLHRGECIHRSFILAQLVFIFMEKEPLAYELTVSPGLS